MPLRFCVSLLVLVWCQVGLAADAWKVGEPIVSYWAGPGFPGGGALDDAAAERLVAGGYNLVWCSEKELDVAHRHHLRGLLTDPLLGLETLKDPKRREALVSLVDRVKAHPALYAYHLGDEPSAPAFPGLSEMVSLLRQQDPAHLAYMNLLPVYATNQQFGTEGTQVQAYAEYLRLFAETVRPGLLSYDHYQFTRQGDSQQYFLNLAMVRDRAQASGVPFLNIVQASSWVPGSAASPSSPRVPDPDELRYLVYTTLGYGAQGITYYVYRYPGHEGGLLAEDGTPTSLGKAAETLNREFVAIARELQPLRSLGIHHAGMQPPGTQPLPKEWAWKFDPAVVDEPYKPGERVRGIMLGRFGPQGSDPEGTHGLVVNLDYRSERTVTLVSPSPLEVFDATSGRWSPVGLRAELRLVGGSGKLVRRAP